MRRRLVGRTDELSSGDRPPRPKTPQKRDERFALFVEIGLGQGKSASDSSWLSFFERFLCASVAPS